MYKPIQVKGGSKTIKSTTLMAKTGENLRDLPQLLSPEFALTIRNYIVTTDGGLAKRKGITRLFNVIGTDKITMLEKYTSDIYLYAYANKLAAYDKIAGTSTVIHTFTSAGTASGQRYGDYFFVCNKSETIARVSRTLAYDTQTANFTVGKILTGGTSGATATILEDSDAGATGTLTLGNIQGTFVAGETITDSATGSAKVTSAVAWAYSNISGAPICSVLKVVASRLYAGNLTTDETAVAYSAVDTGTNPPFTNWTTGTNATDPGLVSFRNAGKVNAIESLGNNIVVFSDNGKFAFNTTTIDSGGTLKKVDNFVITRTDFGGAVGAITTPKGLFYIGKSSSGSLGLWQLVSLGQSNVPFSDQEGMTSVLLGTTYFNNIDASNCSIVYDAKLNTIFVALAKDSATNNFVLYYNTENKAFGEITGWNINRFMHDGADIYGGSSLATRVWKCFDGYSDDGIDIWTDYYQELKVAELEQRGMLLGQYVDGFLSPSSQITISFDIYDVQGNFIKDKLQFLWTSHSAVQSVDGYGTAEFGGSAYGGDVDNANMVECFDGGRGYIRNLQRIRIHITSNDKLPHILNWVKIVAKPKVDIRRRKLTQL